MKFPNGLQIVSLEKNLAQVQLKAPVREASVSFDPKLPDRVREIMTSSQYAAAKSDFNFNFRSAADVLPKDEDYIYVEFRALSKTVVKGHWLDWTVDGVLEEAVAMLEGATVYPNHIFWDINNWLGSVSQTSWDATGERFGGVPGINAVYKIDALVSPGIARGLLMKPPAIHSTSLTVLFEFEPSHAEIFNEDRYKFFRLLGEEVDGSIVRLIVKKIHEVWEASLVFQGADRLAKQPKRIEEEDFDDESLGAASFSSKPANSNEERKMKLTKEQKAALGIEFDGDDIPETEILKAAETLAAQVKGFDGVDIAQLQAKASVADAYVEEKRTEVTRLAKLAELGSEEGELDDVVSQTIADADFTRLQGLEKYFSKKAADRIPDGRSSIEDGDAVDNAGGVSQQAKQTVPAVGLHD